VVVAFLATLLAQPASAGVVQFTVNVHDDSGSPMPARVLVRDAGGKSCVPPVAVTENIGPDTWFASGGSSRLDVPAGHYHVEVERGPEFVPMSADVDVPSNGSTDLALHRWVDLSARGYRSGENHLHVAPALVRPLMDAEALDYGSSLQWWNGPKFSAPAAPDPRVTFNDVEVENAWGAVYCIGLNAPMTLAWNSSRANVAFIDEARTKGAVVCYQGGWSAEALVDALLGKVDVINIGDNLFHRHKFMPRSRYSNVVGAPDLPVYPDTADGMQQLATESYYRLLNCGLHLAAGGGSATGVKSNPAGYNRAYVRVPRDATAREFLAGWRAGRNFVTNGPMIFLTASREGDPAVAETGDTMALPVAGGRVHVHVDAAWYAPLRSVQVVVNGGVVAQSTNGTPIDATVDVKQGSWIAALATAEEPGSDAELARYRQTSRLGGEEPTRLRFAHTSPIYVTVAGAGARVERSLAEANRLLDGFARFADATASEAYRAEIQQAIASARQNLNAPTAPKPPAANSAIIPAKKEGTWLKRHEEFVEEARRGGIDLLFLGDSITDFWRENNPRRGGRPVWDREFAPLHAANFGIAGDRTQNVLWRITHGELDGISPKVVVLMIGTNNTGFEHDKVTVRNTPAQAVEGVTAIIRELRTRLPHAKILLLAVFPKGDKPGGRGRLDVAAINREIVALNDPPMVRFLDIGPSFLGPDGTISADVMADFGHPTLKGYEIWAAAMKPLLHNLMNE
jgi:lysophospholipase L1-like esterase